MWEDHVLSSQIEEPSWWHVYLRTRPAREKLSVYMERVSIMLRS